MAYDIRRGIIDAAGALGISPLDLATAISYETGGSFDARQRGPTTKWGQHRGYIQFGEPQAKKYGVDWNNPEQSQLGREGAVVKYLRDTGVRPGMGLLDVYSAINAGGVGRYDRSDAKAGGAPGTVADKVRNQMAGHRRNAERLLGDLAGLPADGPKGQESYPVFGSMGVASSAASPAVSPTADAVPASIQNAANPSGSTGGMSDVFGMMAALDTPQPQFSDGRVAGPSPEQALGLGQLVEALKKRMVI